MVRLRSVLIFMCVLISGWASFVKWAMVPYLYCGSADNSGEGTGKPGFKSQLQHSLMGTVVKILPFLKPQFLLCTMGINRPSRRRCCECAMQFWLREPSPEHACHC